MLIYVESFVREHPIGVILVGWVVYAIFKNHIFATPRDLKDNKSQCEAAIIEKLKRDNIFVTPEQLTSAVNSVKSDVDRRFLTVEVFKEFRRNMDNQFKTVFSRFDEGTQQMKELFHGVNEIKSFLMKEKK